MNRTIPLNKVLSMEEDMLNLIIKAQDKTQVIQISTQPVTIQRIV